MTIGVNSRLFQNSETGIPYFIKCLYADVTKADKHNKYLFFQTSEVKKLGETKVIKMRNSNIYNILFDMVLVLFLIVKNKVKIFHSPSNVLPLIKIPGVKYVLTIHDLSFLIFPNQYPKLFNLYYPFITRISVKNADLIIADSLSTKNDIIKCFNVPENRIKVIYLGINDIYRTKVKKPSLIKEKYIFSMTTHPKRKNIFGVLEAISEKKELQKYKFVIAGLIPKIYLGELKLKIKKLHLEEMVILFGYAREEELVSLYQNAEMFVYPSFYEGFGLPVLEAMSCECPVIVSDNSSLVEVIPDKKWAVDPNSTHNISKRMVALVELSKMSRSELVEKNLKYSEKFNWSLTAKEYISIFNK